MGKSVFKYKIFTYENFDLESFINFIMENFFVQETYTIIISLGFEGNSVFLTTSRQFGIKIVDKHNIDYYKNIYNIIIFTHTI